MKKYKKKTTWKTKNAVFLIVKWFLIVNPKTQKKPTWEQGKPVFSQCLRISKLNPCVWLSNKIPLRGITN